MSSARPPEERVLEIFHTIREAMLRSDREVLLEHVAEDYQGSDAGGRLHGKDSMVSAYGPGGVDLEAFDVSELETRAWADTVLVTGRGWIKGSYGEFDFEHDLRFLDVYAKRDGAWKVVASHVTDIAAE